MCRENEEVEIWEWKDRERGRRWCSGSGCWYCRRGIEVLEEEEVSRIGFAGDERCERERVPEVVVEDGMVLVTFLIMDFMVW